MRRKLLLPMSILLLTILACGQFSENDSQTLNENQRVLLGELDEIPIQATDTMNVVDLQWVDESRIIFYDRTEDEGKVNLHIGTAGGSSLVIASQLDVYLAFDFAP
jgi:hypothetical protein